MVDHEKFRMACDYEIGAVRGQNGIGTLGEKTLHAVLKRYFEPHSDCQEIKIDRFVADICGENGIIEIQTQHFDRLREKLAVFLDAAHVTVVYPIPAVKWLCWIDNETGEVTKKRKSTKKYAVYDSLYEMYKIKPLLKNENLSFCFVLLELTEYRHLDGWSDDRKRGSTRCDRVPSDIIDEIYINSVLDYSKFIPESLPPQFTAKDFEKAAHLSKRSGSTALNVLYEVGAVARCGKSGNAFIYERTT